MTATGLHTLPNGASSLIVDPSESVLSARREEAAASVACAQARAQWRKRLFMAQGVVAGVLFLRWLTLHSVFASLVMAGLAFLMLGLLSWLAAVIMTRGAKRAAQEASARLAAARQAEVERNLASLTCGRYQWIRRGGEYLAVFPDAGFLYHFGTASGQRHLMLDAKRAVQAVRVATRTSVRETTTSSTTHGRRMIVAPTSQVGVLGKGRSTTRTTTETTSTTTHQLEIQAQMQPGSQPFWITIPFGENGREAEDWKLLVSQLHAQA